jgi:putative mRNA 3-end processing factor
VTHGFQAAFSRYLNEKNLAIAAEVKTQFGDEDEETSSPLEIKNEQPEKV